jgi:hypothetical protein
MSEQQSTSSTPSRDPDAPESIGELYDRLPKDEWVNLPEYGIRVKAINNPPEPENTIGT